MPTRSSIASALARASGGATPRWTSRPSVICRPIVSIGLSEVMGSWKIMPMRSPRTRLRSASVIVARSRPSKAMAPPATRPAPSGKSPIIESAVTLLPEPDSPTSATASPGATEKDSPSTATVRPKATVRPSTSSRGALTGILSAGRAPRAARRRGG